jgi:hypothetical protein
MRHWSLSLLLVLSAALLDTNRAPAGAASGNILTTPQKTAPQLQNPQPNPNALKSNPAMMKTPGFEIGYLIPSRAGFQKCSAPAGFVGPGQIGPTDRTAYLATLYCAKGNVTVTQTNPLLNMTGKKLRLLVTTVSLVGGQGLGSAYESDWYQLPFQNQNSVTFQIILASGRASNGQDDPTYLSRAFQNGTSLKIDAQYNGTSYATLNCTFKSYPGATSAPIGSNDPPPDTVSCP